MKRADILIIGAGAAGLMAARVLAKAGRKVIVLEARDRIGGRIYSMRKEGTSQHIELGAEFVHGDLPVTLQLMQEAGIKLSVSEGQTWHSAEKEITQQQHFVSHGELILEKLKQQREDISIYQFLQENFAGDEYAELRSSLSSYIEGYDAGDTHRASTLALREEWTEEEPTQYRPEGGYHRMIDYLVDECKKNGVKFYLSTVVKTIQWKKDLSELITSDHNLFAGNKVIVTVPLGVLKSAPHQGGLTFLPSIPDKIKAVHALGFGAVIKFLVLFKDSFWENYTNSFGKETRLNDMGFLFSEATIPTWWTQYSADSSLLTGWLAGPKAERLKDADVDALKRMAIDSLSEVFLLYREEVESRIVFCEVKNWAADPFTKGAYAYSTIETPSAREELKRPVEDTIYFAGEALHEGAALGTVEAALASGLFTANKLLSTKDIS